ncbi:hypothetical protein GCM10027592_12120 [Spirosoma flavus]
MDSFSIKIKVNLVLIQNQGALKKLIKRFFFTDIKISKIVVTTITFCSNFSKFNFNAKAYNSFVDSTK